MAACLARRVSTERPTTKIAIEMSVPQPAFDKVDLLLMIDSSSSMADKQEILADAVPDLVRGLVAPPCVDRATAAPTGVRADPMKNERDACPAGSEPAFTPIADIHVGIVSSSMGGFGSSSCSASGAGARIDDHGRLVARGVDGGTVPSAGDLGFLAWYPDVETNRDKDRHPEPPVPKTTNLDALGTSLGALVRGVGQEGCGLEAQLESVYHFLVAPDPWKAIGRSGEQATYGAPGEVDEALLVQRAAFLRPDSLVAVVALTDEDDSSVDPLSFRGSAWRFMQDAPMPRATAACRANPSDPKCTSCYFAPTDPSCADGAGNYTSDADPLNVRFHRMKERYGVDPQYPLTRYVDGFTKPKVARRDAEHDANGNYNPRAECTNPLFAARLPTSAGEELCKLPLGSRSASSIFYAVIGGVPHQYLPASKDATAAIDWTKILGRDPAKWNDEGLDPHMLQSTVPRSELPGPNAADDADPIHGREWTTGGTDLQYACTFDLMQRLPGGGTAPIRRECPPADLARGLCDCDGKKDTPLCDPADRTIQTKGKSYPTRRELVVAKDLEDRGIVASLCPEQLTDPNADTYGYRPAIAKIEQRLIDSLRGACLTRPLTPDAEGKVGCIVSAVLPEEGADSECASRFGLENPPPAILKQVRDKLVAEEGASSARFPICALPQWVPPAGERCRQEEERTAFCYERVPGSRCQQALTFTKAATRLTNARFRMLCIQLEEHPDD